MLAEPQLAGKNQLCRKGKSRDFISNFSQSETLYLKVNFVDSSQSSHSTLLFEK